MAFDSSSNPAQVLLDLSYLVANPPEGVVFDQMETGVIRACALGMAALFMSDRVAIRVADDEDMLINTNTGKIMTTLIEGKTDEYDVDYDEVARMFGISCMTATDIFGSDFKAGTTATKAAAKLQRAAAQLLTLGG